MLFAAVVDEEITGYVCLITRKKIGVIYSIVVDEAWRGIGLGTKLLEMAEEYALNKGIFLIRLEVRCSNKAFELYKRLGYSTLEIKKNYYDDGEDAYSMIKEPGQQRGDSSEKININGYGYNSTTAATVF